MKRLLLTLMVLSFFLVSFSAFAQFNRGGPPPPPRPAGGGIAPPGTPPPQPPGRGGGRGGGGKVKVDDETKAKIQTRFAELMYEKQAILKAEYEAKFQERLIYILGLNLVILLVLAFVFRRQTNGIARQINDCLKKNRATHATLTRLGAPQVDM